MVKNGLKIIVQDTSSLYWATGGHPRRKRALKMFKSNLLIYVRYRELRGHR